MNADTVVSSSTAAATSGDSSSGGCGSSLMIPPQWMGATVGVVRAKQRPTSLPARPVRHARAAGPQTALRDADSPCAERIDAV
ncbi:hypothetical protein Sya03_05160 [Spirilliplanes yamanashiensis]|uniref:Uncharacterized protein n=1 Tax=Spirilliplanes yamanashiensis TaxID=42233 RepID=A0A8J3Y4B3_9ACTN|nr:hypothetical protein Sya03_05160 [Spirilliplanes yamanashiensis]